LRWPIENGVRHDLGGRHVAPGRPPVAGRNERRRSGPPLRRAWQVRTLRLRPVCRRLSNKMVPEGRRHAPAMFRRSAKPLSGRYLSLANGRACDPTCAGRGCGRSPGRWGGQRRRSRGSCDAMPRRAAGPGLSGNQAPVACGPGRSAPKACEAGDQRGAASVCAGSISRRGRNAAWGCGSRSGGVLKGRRHGRRRSRWASAWSPEQIAHRLRLDFRTMRRCASATKPFTSRFTCKAVGSAPRADRCLRTGRALRVPRARTRGRASRSSSPRS